MNKILVIVAIAALEFGLIIGFSVSFWWNYTHGPVPLMTSEDIHRLMVEK